MPSCASRATRAMACSSPAPSSPAKPPCTATTSPPFPITRRRSARPPARPPGVSGYQIQFAAHEVYSPGDQPDTLVAMNPAALKVHLPDLKRGGLLIVNDGAFKQSDLERAGWKANPLEDGTLEGYRVIKVDFERLVGKAVEGTGVSARDAARCKNFFALGLVFWIYSRDVEREEHAIRERFTKKPGWPRPTCAPSRRATTTARPSRRCDAPLRHPAGAAQARQVPQHHRQQRHRPRAHRRRAEGRPAAVLRQLSDHARLRHPPRALASTRLRRHDVPGRRRDRRHRRRRSAQPSAARSASPRLQRPGHRAQDRGASASR